MIAVIDSGVANLESVMAALRRINADAKLTADANEIKNAERVILPGVGAALPAMEQLKSKRLVEVIQKLTQPVLGICLGMQLLFERSTESGGTQCLGVLPGTIDRLPPSPDKPVPHMGWNQLQIKNAQHPLLRGIANDSFVYFVHSFAAPVGDITLASTGYSATFSSSVARDNFMGCQFHPERSGAVGSQILKNFMSL
ncbi:MAG TPA: imidazole glycerol phosphate synthase subunit HisH [Alphaproteobacteria bacterium]|nr:imidazole glycerol phosphate synthase subunit HisH [Alphaproteobacteria bacterium]